jgi:hypothetical protein
MDHKGVIRRHRLGGPGEKMRARLIAEAAAGAKEATQD